MPVTLNRYSYFIFLINVFILWQCSVKCLKIGNLFVQYFSLMNLYFHEMYAFIIKYTTCIVTLIKHLCATHLPSPAMISRGIPYACLR